MHTYDPCGKKRTSNTKKLELQVFVSYQVGAGIKPWFSVRETHFSNC